MRHFNTKLFLLLFGLSVISTPSWARGRQGAGDAETVHNLTLGGGISSPGILTGMGENPAGLTYNNKLRFQLHTSTTDLPTSITPVGIGGGVYWGNGWISLGAEGVGSVGGANNGVTIDTGIAFHIPQIKTALGFSYGIPIGGGADIGANMVSGSGDIGLLFLPHEVVSIGTTLYSVAGGLPGIGFGISAKPTPFMNLVLDASYGFQSQGITLKPALGFHWHIVQLMFGYGIGLNGSGTGITEGASAGLGFNFGKTASLQMYYNQLSQVYIGMTFSL